MHSFTSITGRAAPFGTLLITLLFLTACGGGGGGGGGDGGGNSQPDMPAIATASDNLFPLDTNARWSYTSSAGMQMVGIRAAGSRTISGGGNGIALRAVDPNDSSDDTTTYVANANGVRQYAAADASALERSLDGIEILRWPARAGDTWVQVDATVNAGEDFDGDGRFDAVSIRAETTAVGLETVISPAGTFERCLLQRQLVRQTVQYTSGQAPVTITATIETWLAPNIGTVKTVLRIVGPTLNTFTTQTLERYRVGSRSNDTVAPTVIAVTPTETHRGTTIDISAAFSEALDPDSFSLDTFTVRDSANVTIPGTVQFNGNTARFIPGPAWASGSYTATVTTAAQDLMGNPLATARSWIFTVDATAPGVVASTPLAEATDVLLDSVIVMRFSEPIDPASVSVQSLFFNDGIDRVAFTFSVSENEITARPSAALKRATRYTFSVGGVTDLAGNPMTSGYEASFRTTQGRFAYPQSLDPGLDGGALEVGDVNGDGIADVVMVGQPRLVSGVPGLYVLAGRADGSRAAAKAIALPSTWTCSSLETIALGDFNGDGRLDVAVGSNYCGVLVLHQSAGGDLVAGAFLPGAARVLRAADLDGDGRTDLVAIGGNQDTGIIWRQDSGGQMVQTDTPNVGVTAPNDLAIGDINGDGRPDLLVAMNRNANQHVALLLQRADGSFSAPSFLSTQSVWGASALALGDVNGDGRIDIVATTGGNSPTSFAVFYQGANASFGPATLLATYDSPSDVKVADIDGDGRADIVVAHEGWSSVSVYLQQPGGLPGPEVRYAAPYRSGLTVADINRDGRLDIIQAGELIRQLPTAQGASSSSPGAVGAGLSAVQRAMADTLRRGKASQ